MQGFDSKHLGDVQDIGEERLKKLSADDARASVHLNRAGFGMLMS